MIFVSKYLGLKKVIVPARYVYDNAGQRRYQAGKLVEFVDGRMETYDNEVIEFLNADNRYGLDFWALDADGKAIPGDQMKLAKEIKTEQDAIDTTVGSCPKCSFKAVNRAGLQAHIRAKHNEGNPDNQTPATPAEPEAPVEPDFTQGEGE